MPLLCTWASAAMTQIIDFLRAKRLRRLRACQLASEIATTLRPGMILPEPLLLLFEWIERNGFHEGTRTGRVGYLFPQDQMRAGWTDEARPGGTDISFGARDGDDLKYWFGSQNPEIRQRLCVFAQTGSEGSLGAFWLADDGSQKIVHMGSGSGSPMVCILADDPVDFLRLIAIGYDEICWGEHFAAPPSAADPDFTVHPNRAFRGWVERTFAVTIPERGAEIVRHPGRMHAPNSPDAFWQWAQAMADSPPVFVR